MKQILIKIATTVGKEVLRYTIKQVADTILKSFDDDSNEEDT